MAKYKTEKKIDLYQEQWYASAIHIRNNSEDMGAGVIQLDMHLLEYHDGVYQGSKATNSLGELVSSFCQRTFVVGDKEITGLEVAEIIKQYTEILIDESEAASE